MGFLGAAAGIGASVVGGIEGASATGHAATVEAQAAEKAQALEKQNQDAAIAAQNTATSTNTANQAPYTALGATSAADLQKLLQGGFTAPTLADAQNNPGYHFALQSGTTALDKSAAATGNVFTGTQGTALQQYGQQLGEQNYNDVYNRAVQSYMTNYNTLAGGTQIGEGAVSQEGQLGQAGAQNIAGIDVNEGQQQAQQINNAAAARASGYLGAAKAYSGMASGIAGSVGSLGNMFQNSNAGWENG